MPLSCMKRADGCGRACLGQCFHFDAEWLHEPEKLVRASFYFAHIDRIKSVKSVSDIFMPAFLCRASTTYNYYLGRADPDDDRYVWACRDLPLDLKEMQAAADRLLGTHDFSALVRRTERE